MQSLASKVHTLPGRLRPAIAGLAALGVLLAGPAARAGFLPGGYCTTTASGKFRLGLNLLDKMSNDTIETVQGTK